MEIIFEIVGFFKPEANIIWDVLKFVIFLFCSFILIWMIELWLCRNWRPSRKDIALNIYFSWLALFTVYGGIEIIFSIILLNYYQNNGFTLYYTAPYFGLGALSLGTAWYFNRKIAGMLSET
ncbi:MAG: hypothetical protein QME81_14660 [bacterium]|nr:hypothetical protein [bacterium]